MQTKANSAHSTGQDVMHRVPLDWLEAVQQAKVLVCSSANCLHRAMSLQCHTAGFQHCTTRQSKGAALPPPLPTPGRFQSWLGYVSTRLSLGLNSAEQICTEGRN